MRLFYRNSHLDMDWTNFPKHRFESEPLVIRPDGHQRRPIAPPHVIYGGFKKAVSRWIAGKPAKVRTYVDGRLVEGWPDAAFYEPLQDRSFDAYSRRISKSMKGDTFGIIINDFNEYCPNLWLRQRAFLSRFQEHHDLSYNFVHSGLFCGTYAVSPFGIHRDKSGGFMFPIVGTKRLLLWPRDYFSRRAARLCGSLVIADPMRFRRDAIELVASPGDILYWPSSYWHTAVSDDQGFHAAVTIGFWPQDEAAYVGGILADELRARFSNLSAGSHRKRDAVLSAAIRFGKDLISKALQERILDNLKRQQSAGGYRSVPMPLRRGSVAVTDKVFVHHPILLQKHGVCRAFANGHAIALHDTHAQFLVGQLAPGHWYSVRELIRTISRARADHTELLSRATVLPLLTELLRLRVLVKAPGKPVVRARNTTVHRTRNNYQNGRGARHADHDLG